MRYLSDEEYIEMIEKHEQTYINYLNCIYKEYGFSGIIEEVEDRLQYGEIKKENDGLYRISTGGYSEDEDLLYCLTHLLSIFGYKHYVGYLRGGAFYFSEKEHDDDIVIRRKVNFEDVVGIVKSDEETNSVELKRGLYDDD